MMSEDRDGWSALGYGPAPAAGGRAVCVLVACRRWERACALMQAVEAEASELLKRMAPYPNFVLSTGCDMPQETPLENIHAFMRAGRRYRAKKGGK